MNCLFYCFLAAAVGGCRGRAGGRGFPGSFKFSKPSPSSPINKTKKGDSFVVESLLQLLHCTYKLWV